MSKITQMKKAAKAAAATAGVPAATRPAIVGMKAEAIDAVARQIKPGDTVTFRYDYSADPIDTRFLIFGEKDGVIELGRMDSITITAIFQSHDWDGGHNKIVTFKAGPNFTYEWFRTRVQPRIDYVGITS